MSRPLKIALLGLAIAALAGCGEKDQITDRSAKLPDAEPWSSGGHHMAAGWKQGDQASWEQQIRTRNQVQNEYARIR